MIKSLGVLVLASLVSVSASANSKELVKSCSFDSQISKEDPLVSTEFLVMRNDTGIYSAVVNQSVEGQSGSYTDSVVYGEYQIRQEVLEADPYDETIKYNMGEALLAHALMLTTDPDTEGAFSTGLDIRAVKSVKTYQVGQSGIGSSTIIEAMDADGKILGSFLGGFLVFPCK